MTKMAPWLSLFSNPIKLKTVERCNYIEIMQSKIKLVFVFCFIFKGHNYEMVNFLKTNLIFIFSLISIMKK